MVRCAVTGIESDTEHFIWCFFFVFFLKVDSIFVESDEWVKEQNKT